MKQYKYPVKSQKLADLIDDIKLNSCNHVQELRDKSRKLIAEGTRENCLYSRAFGLMSLSDYYADIGDSDSCLYYLLEALDINNKSLHNDLLAKNYNLLGNVYIDYMDHFSAIEAYLNSLEIATNVNLPRTQVSIYNNIGNIFYELEVYDKAVTYFELARIELEHIPSDVLDPNDTIVGIIYANLATVYLHLNNLDKSKENFEISKKYIESSTDFSAILASLNQAMIYEIDGKIDEMYAEFDVMLANAIVSEQHENLFELLVDAIKVLMKYNDTERIYNFLDVLHKMIGSASNYYRMHLYQKLYIVYLEKTNVSSDEILSAYRELYRLDDILNDREHRNTAKSLETKIELFNERLEKAQLLQTSEELQKISLYDELTGILNRRGYNMYLSDILHKAQLNSTNIGLILVDIDCFKEYNDNYGHPSGDTILKHISSLLTKYSNTKFTPCRFGGDEFAIICKDCSTVDIEEYINNIINDLKNYPLEHKYSKVGIDYVSVSCGFANEDASKVTIATLLGNADTALYQAKENGRNQYQKYQ